MSKKCFELYRWYKSENPIDAYERDLSVLRIGRYWLFNINSYSNRIFRSTGIRGDFNLCWPVSYLLTFRVHLNRYNVTLSLLNKDFELWDDDIDWGGPSELTIDEKPKNEGA